MRTKFSLLSRNAQLSEHLRESIHQRSSQVGQRRIYEGGPAAFSSICIEGELRNDNRCPTRIEDRKVHLSLIILEDAQVGDFFSKSTRGSFTIVMADPQQDDQTRTDFSHNTPFNRDFSAADPL